MVRDEDALIDRVEEYLKGGCVMEDEFLGRVEKLFKFDDRNNCKRVYDWIVKH